MKVGATNTYINAGLAALLEVHGPQEAGARPLSAKLNYIMPAWDAILREEEVRWRKALMDFELSWLLALGRSSLGSLEAMPSAGAAVNALTDALARASEAGEREAAPILVRVQKASTAARIALVWMIQSRKKDPPAR